MDENLLNKSIKKYQGNTYSQLKQDIFVLILTNFKRNGFFVEFGVMDGLDLSNTLLLEKEYNWSGILSEPSKIHHDQIKTNRTAKFDPRAVYSKTGHSLSFKEVDIAGLSGLNDYFQKDGHGKNREVGTEYLVETISLHDLLEQNNAPYVIDYLSVDTEGSEYEILSNFDFTSYQINILTVEHNYIKETRKNIKDYLESKGYSRILEGRSKWDDWYILKNKDH